ncbi:MAG: hypothetical protein M3261_07615 [Thermoproteota archaeon]|nr:hypothetical protein [Thermoproteota archaeon]
MANQRLPNEDDVHRVSGGRGVSWSSHGHEKQGEEPRTTTLPANEEEENEENRPYHLLM